MERVWEASEEMEFKGGNVKIYEASVGMKIKWGNWKSMEDASVELET